MPNFDNWIGTNYVIDEGARAVAAWNRISQKPSTITVIRIAPITGVRSTHEEVVRIEYDNESDEYNTVGNSGVNQLQEAVVFGVRNHPSRANTDLQRGDVFYHNGLNYRIVMPTVTLGELQCLAEVQI